MKLFISVCFLHIVIGFHLNKVTKVIKFDRYEVCEAGPKNPFLFNNLVITTINHGSYINGYLNMLHDVKSVDGVTIMHRCSNKETLDSCVFFGKLVTKDTCLLLKQNGTVLSPMIYNNHPPFICPFRKGIYKIINGSYDPNLISFFPLENWYWKFQWKLYDSYTKDFYLTFCIAGQIVVNIE